MIWRQYRVSVVELRGYLPQPNSTALSSRKHGPIYGADQGSSASLQAHGAAVIAEVG
jgi:hypothetical protein